MKQLTINDISVELKIEIATEFIKDIYKQCCEWADEDWSHCNYECPVDRHMFCLAHNMPYKWNYKRRDGENSIKRAVRNIFLKKQKRDKNDKLC